MMEQLLAYAEKTWGVDLHQVNQLSAEQLLELTEVFSVDQKTCLYALLPLAANYALVPLSNYHVGSIVVGLSGNAYFGANMEFGDQSLSQTVHAEQAAINHAWLCGEEGISDIYVNQSPCGHCRQFMNELSTSEQLTIHVQGRESVSLAQLLPDAFGPNDLGVANRLMSIQTRVSSSESSHSFDELAWKRVYSPYTESPSMCLITLEDGKRIIGCYAENAAFNPSLSPLQSALIMLRLALRDFDSIVDVELIESKQSQVLQYDATLSLLKSIAPKVELRYTNLSN
ncbi:cytidine deaminase [Vibrio sp. RC27]